MKELKRWAAACGLVACTLTSHSAPAITHSVVGSAEEQQQIAPFGVSVTITVRLSVAAFQDAQGAVWGELISNIDLRPLGLSEVTFSSIVDCLEVVGNQAWIGSTVTTSTNPEIFPLGDTGIAYIQDLGGNGQDLMFGAESDAFPTGTTCADRPAISGLTVSSGNYLVR